jgi:NTF2 fold immunity protein of polymorphic toxin system component
MRLCAALCCSLLMITLAIGQSDGPKRVYVPDSATAVKIAEAVLIPVYGKKHIESEEPFHAKLENDVWTVSGTLRCPDGKGSTTSQCNGGVAVVQLSKVDARILSMIHYK